MAIHSALLEKKRTAAGETRDRHQPEQRSWRVLAAALAGSWALPLATHLVGADIVLLPVLVLAVASLLRVGGGLLDRLFVAGFLLCGAVMAFGLLFSVWPWGLSPVATVGVLLSVVSVTGWTARRRPRLPWRRVRGTDLFVLGTGAVMCRYLFHIAINRSDVSRLPYILTSEDRMGHFSYFDGILQVGGYAFLNQDAARAYMMTPAEAVYPQGTHFLLAWVDVLVRSSTDVGPALGTMNRYFLYTLFINALLCAAVVWAARWIGGPRLRGWRAAAICGTAAGVMLSGFTVWLTDRGFDSEVAGLLFVTVTTALLLRPAMGRAEFVLVALAGLVTVTYVYNLYGIFVGIALTASVLVYRRRFVRQWRLFAILGAGLVVAGLPSVMSVLTKLDVAKTSNLAGPMAAADRVILVGGGLLVLLAALMPANRRTATGQTVLFALLGVGSVVCVFGLWQKLTIGYLSYYFEKLAMGALFTIVVCFGVVGAMLRPVDRLQEPRTRRRIRTAMLSTVAGAAALSLFAQVQWGFPSPEGLPSKKNQPSGFHQNLLVNWSKGNAKSDMGPTSKAFLTRDLQRIDPHRPVITLYSNDAYQNLKTTFLAQLMTRQAGNMVGLYEVYYVKIGGKPTTEANGKDNADSGDKDGSENAAKPAEPTPKAVADAKAKADAEAKAKAEEEYRKSLDHLVKAIGTCAQPPTVLVGDAGVAQRLTRDLAARKVDATVVHAPLPK